MKLLLTSCFLSGWVMATAAAAGPASRGGGGSAIAPAFSLQHDAVRSGEDVTLLACVVNDNAESGQDVLPGDISPGR